MDKEFYLVPSKDYNKILNNTKKIQNTDVNVEKRIDLKSARSIFNSLKTSLKIKLPVDLMNSIDGIIMNNMTAFLDNYAHDLSDIRYS